MEKELTLDRIWFEERCNKWVSSTQFAANYDNNSPLSTQTPVPPLSWAQLQHSFPHLVAGWSFFNTSGRWNLYNGPNCGGTQCKKNVLQICQWLQDKYMSKMAAYEFLTNVIITLNAKQSEICNSEMSQSAPQWFNLWWKFSFYSSSYLQLLWYFCCLILLLSLKNWKEI